MGVARAYPGCTRCSRPSDFFCSSLFRSGMFLTLTSVGLPPPSFFYSMSHPTDSWVTDLNEVPTATASSPSLFTVGSTTARFLSVGSSMVPNPSADMGSGIPDGEYDGAPSVPTCSCSMLSCRRRTVCAWVSWARKIIAFAFAPH